MIRSEEIYEKARKIIKRAGTRDVKAIARELNVEIYWNGTFESLLGMYTIIKKKKAIVLNNRLDEYMTSMVIAHELGHNVLHRELATQGAFQEFQLFDMRSRTEYEANAFAAHLLIDTDEFVEMAHDGQDIMAIASAMGVNINLALIKLRELTNLGYDLRVPMEARGDFLKDITV